MKKLAGIALGTVLAGCVCSREAGDGAVGNWSLDLPYETMKAGQLEITRKGGGKFSGLVLWRWAEPTEALTCEVRGNRFCLVHPWRMILEGEVDGNGLTGTITPVKPDGTADLEHQDRLVGRRNPPIEPAHTSLAKLGEPIDLLKDGLDGWVAMDAKAKFGWSFKDGVLSNKLGKKADGSWNHGGANLMTRRSDFYDFNLSYDVRVPKASNSGVYLRGRYEIQVVDSYGQDPSFLNMASLYGRIVPSVAAEKPAGEWQHVDVTLYKRHLTVLLNGVKIIDNAPVSGVTGGAIDSNEFVSGPIYLQGDHSDADYRNMILRPVVD